MKRSVLLIITGVFCLSLTGTLKAQSKLPVSYEITCEFLPEHASYKVYEIPNNSFMRGKTPEIWLRTTRYPERFYPF